MIFSPNSFFVAWSGVLACLFDDFPELVHKLKTHLDDTCATHIPKENPGSKFPKMTLAALHDGRVLSSNDLLRLTLLCQLYHRIIRSSHVVLYAENMSLLTFHNRMLSRVSCMREIRVPIAPRANSPHLKAEQNVTSCYHRNFLCSAHPATESQRILSEVCLDKPVSYTLSSTPIFAQANTSSPAVTHFNEDKRTTVTAAHISECSTASSNSFAEATPNTCLSLVGEHGMLVDVNADVNPEALVRICASPEAVCHIFKHNKLARLVNAVARCIEEGTLLLCTETNASNFCENASISSHEQSQALHARLAAYLPQVQRAGSRMHHYTEPCTGHTLVVRLADIAAAKTSVPLGVRVDTLLIGGARVEMPATHCEVPVDVVANTAMSPHAGVATGSAATPQEPLARGDSHAHSAADGCDYLHGLYELLSREVAHVLASQAQCAAVAGDTGGKAMGNLPVSNTTPVNGDVEAAMRNKEEFLHLLACFQRDVEALLPGYYHFFPVDSLHITIRGL